MPESLISIQQYAIKNKLSTFATVKLINQGKIKTIKKVVDGEEREFVIMDNVTHSQTESTQTSSTPIQTISPINYEEQYHQLLAKYSTLLEKYTQLLEDNSHATK